MDDSELAAQAAHDDRMAVRAERDRLRIALAAAEAERDQARSTLEEHRIAYTALTGERDAAEARATRLAALEQAARAWAAAVTSHSRVPLEALLAAVGALDAPPEVCQPCQRGDHWRCVFNGGDPCGCSVRPSEWEQS